MAEILPALVNARNRVLAIMQVAGFPMRQAGQAVRTTEEQSALYAQGRVTKGPDVGPGRPLGRTVTDADGVHVKSNHQVAADGFGHAVDCCFLGPDPWLDQLEPMARDARWNLYGAAIEALATLTEFKGLKWGGRFPKVDRPHMELK